MSQIVWVAIIDDMDAMTVQPCASKEAALEWLASKISQDDWAQFYDSLPENEREGLTRDKEGMDIDTLLRGYCGREHGEGDDGAEDWGDSAYSMSVAPHEVYYSGLVPEVDGVGENYGNGPDHLASVDGWMVGDKALYASPVTGSTTVVEIAAVSAPSPRPLLIHPADTPENWHLRWTTWTEPKHLSAVHHDGTGRDDR